jgi:hypothetical protein
MGSASSPAMSVSLLLGLVRSRDGRTNQEARKPGKERRLGTARPQSAPAATVFRRRPAFAKASAWRARLPLQVFAADTAVATDAQLMDRKPLMIATRETMLRKLECFAITRRPRLSSFQRSAFRFSDRDHLSRVGTCELAPAGETATPANLREILTNSLFSFSHRIFNDAS